jgi:hypothetical protein
MLGAARARSTRRAISRRVTRARPQSADAAVLRAVCAQRARQAARVDVGDRHRAFALQVLRQRAAWRKFERAAAGL